MTSKQIFNNLNEYFRDNIRDLINNRWLFTMINIIDSRHLLKLPAIKYAQIHIEEAFKRYYFFFFIFFEKTYSVINVQDTPKHATRILWIQWVVQHFFSQ